MLKMNTKIGIDLDNTIIDYDQLFYKEAFKKRLIPKKMDRNRIKIRNYIKKKSVTKWKQLQSNIYSTYLDKAILRKGFIKFIIHLTKRGFNFCIISHKTKYPYIGKKINLHNLSKKWIENNINKKLKKYDCEIKKIFFETTEKKKIKKIINEKCDYFIDDLPSILISLPKNFKKILIDPQKNYNKKSNFLVLNEWKNISKIF